MRQFAIPHMNTARIVSNSEKKCLCLFVVTISSQAGSLFVSTEKHWFGSLTPSVWKPNLTCRTITEKKVLAVSFYKHFLLLSIFWQISDSKIICWHPFQGFNCNMHNYKFSVREQSIDCVIIIAVQIEYFMLAAIHGSITQLWKRISCKPSEGSCRKSINFPVISVVKGTSFIDQFISQLLVVERQWPLCKVLISAFRV